MFVTEKKAQLRKRFLQYRTSLSPREKAESDARITAQVLSSDAYLSAQTVLCYVSLPQEIDTTCILANALMCGKRIAVPRCRGNGQMDFFVISSPDDLLSGMHGIPEPKETCSLCTPQPDDLCIVPCLAADARGFRLGYGGGYYDRYLAQHPVRTIGLCHAASVTQTLPTDSFDIPLQKIVTEKEV